MPGASQVLICDASQVSLPAGELEAVQAVSPLSQVTLAPGFDVPELYLSLAPGANDIIAPAIAVEWLSILSDRWALFTKPSP
jgi:hypothetical protein